MQDDLIWQAEFNRLIKELKGYWAEGRSLADTGMVKLEEKSIRQFVYGYPTFSGERDGVRVSVTIEYFHHAVTSLMNDGDHVEFLHLSVRQPQKGFISLRHEKWFDGLRNKLSTEWEHKTGHPELDQQYFVEARTPENQEFVASPRFHALVRRLEPMASLALRDSAVFWSIPIDSESQLTVEYVDSHWANLTELSRLDMAVR
ncbi:MAG: hypothetical protein DRP45_02390 [Candidatus Zixiibacteriota bacterium]|nr:MAG: hypothetical protein DRP45_02390 [candidate division Zixibacteria bacterium]